MTYDPQFHHRRSLRLRGYDYGLAGAYFVTICTINRQCLFGEVLDEEMRPSRLGEVVAGEWARTAEVRPDVDVDAFVVMPNHLHGIIVLAPDAAPSLGGPRATHRVAPTDAGRPLGPMSGSLGAIVAQFKSVTTKGINRLRGPPGLPVWQRNYYEHVIRNERELQMAREYVLNNPAKWMLDRENVDVTPLVGIRHKDFG